MYPGTVAVVAVVVTAGAYDGVAVGVTRRDSPIGCGVRPQLRVATTGV